MRKTTNIKKVISGMTLGAMLLFVLITNACSSSSSFQTTVSFNTFEDFITYYDSSYCLNRPNYKKNHAIVDTTSSYEGVRKYFIEGVDRCKEFKMNCVETPINNHYLDIWAKGVWEYCILPFSYNSLIGNNIYSSVCDYNLLFMPNDSTAHSYLFEWEEWAPTESEPRFHEKKEFKASEAKLRYLLKSNGETFARFEVHGIPKPEDDTYDREIYEMIIKKIDSIRDSIRTLYQEKFGV